MSLSRLGITERQLPYAEYREQAQNADILLWRPTSVWGHIIASGTRGPWCHAAATKWARNGTDRLLSIQYREGIGGYAIPTRDEVRQHPGRCDVFRVEMDAATRESVTDTLMDSLGGDYNWASIWLIAMGYLPVLRWLHNVPGVETWVERKLSSSAALICSAYVERGFRLHDMPFIRREGGLVSPNDIGRSTLPEYVGTLV